jgi:hypothetical protein
MLTKITQLVKENSNNILLFIVVFLLCLLSFGAGILVQSSLEKPPIEFQQQ